MRRHLIGVLLVLSVALLRARAQEGPYFVTYNHHLEEPGNLEIESSTTMGLPRAGQKFYVAPYMAFEYGVTARWTTEVYIEGQGTWDDSTIFTGWRFENRFRLLKREHWVNPVLYLEYENLNEASRIQKEIAGGAPDVSSPNWELRSSTKHELETKLILSSDVHDWNIAANFIVDKNFSRNEGFEFGYAAGFSRPLGTLASGEKCRFCLENFSAGMEFYGGFGSTLAVSLHDTAHYVAPVFGWQVSENGFLRFSPGIGLTHESNPLLLRFGYNYELHGFGSKVARLFRGKY